MSRRSRSASRHPAQPSRLFRRRVGWFACLGVVVVMVFLARPLYSLWAKRLAVAHLQKGSLTDASRYLQHAAWAAPQDGSVDLMLAFCFRQLGRPEEWRDALTTARQKGIPRADLEREQQLYRIQSGSWSEGTESQLAAFAGQGVTSYDVPAAFVFGSLASGRYELAQQILEVWNADFPNDPHVAFMRGKYWETLGDVSKARSHYETAISVEPRLEAARLSLAELSEENDQLGAALHHFAALASAAPANEVATLGAVRVLRKMGELERAGAVLEPSAQASEPSRKVAEEMARIAMERGRFDEAEQWFQRAGIAQSHDPEFLMDGVRLMGLQGKAKEAERLFQRIAVLGDRVTRARDLRSKLAFNPDNKTIAAEIERLYRELGAEMAAFDAPVSSPTLENVDLSPARRLFAQHCEACHGPDGDGNGFAARHLFPRPRNLRREPSRLVSTQNGVPTLDDTIAMLQRGIPGTSMPSYADLQKEELRLLAEEVRRLRREGLPEQTAEMLRQQGEEVTDDDMEELHEAAIELTTPGEPIVVPPMEPATSESCARGQQAYVRLGCTTCHGEDGAGGEDQMWHDELGFPVRPRDLAREPFKGGRDPAEVYRRIVAGMPGTPHPSCLDVPSSELLDVVHFCLSLAHGPPENLTDFQRSALVSTTAYRESLDTQYSK